MNSHHFTAADLLGITATIGTLSADKWAALASAAVAILAMAPLAFWRWRALLRELRSGKSSRHENPRD